MFMNVTHSLFVFIHKIVPADFSYEIVIVVLQIPKLIGIRIAFVPV